MPRYQDVAPDGTAQAIWLTDFFEPDPDARRCRFGNSVTLELNHTAAPAIENPGLMNQAFPLPEIPARGIVDESLPRLAEIDPLDDLKHRRPRHHDTRQRAFPENP